MSAKASYEFEQYCTGLPECQAVYSNHKSTSVPLGLGISQQAKQYRNRRRRASCLNPADKYHTIDLVGRNAQRPWQRQTRWKFSTAESQFRRKSAHDFGKQCRASSSSSSSTQ